MRMMILAPSASTSMSATVLGDTDMTLMRAHFVKPQAAIAMSFTDDPLMEGCTPPELFFFFRTPPPFPRAFL